MKMEVMTMTDTDKIKLARMLISEFFSYGSDESTDRTCAATYFETIDTILGYEGDDDATD